MRKSLLALSILTTVSMPALAANYTDGDVHKNDYKWLQFNLMGALQEKGPKESTHNYLEMEFGGRSGIFDLYGYVDVFNLTTDKSNDKYNDSKMFMKLAPRMSLDALTGQDLSFGPVKELYLASVMEWGGGVNDLNSQKIGLGSDIQVPWFGKMGLNLYSVYDSSKSDWNGYQLSTSWFKPVINFSNKSFIAYQGYIDYQFGMKSKHSSASHGGAMFNGFYWHSERFSVGYGLKLYHDVYGFENGSPLPWNNKQMAKSSGVGQYFAVGYKF